jgi:sialic acid synthase SpsE
MRPDLYQRIVDETQPPVVVAEAGINHNGDLELARQLVRRAAACGADAIKFQTHLPEFEMKREVPTAGYVGEPLFDLLSRMVLSRAQHQELISLAESLNIQFLSTPFSREAADLLDGLGVPLFKIGSGEATNIPLLRHIAAKGKPMIISSGMTSLEELKETVAEVRKVNPRLVLMHCTSTYPTAYHDVRLRAIGLLRAEFPGLPIGLSDHSRGVYTALAAVALGARVIEKHFTGSRSWPGPDQQVSIEPSELADLTSGVRAVHESLQVGGKQVLPAEVEVQAMARESVIAIADIAAGECFTADNIWVKRPGTGIPAREYSRVLGKRAARNLRRDTLLSFQDIRPQ